MGYTFDNEVIDRCYVETDDYTGKEVWRGKVTVNGTSSCGFVIIEQDGKELVLSEYQAEKLRDLLGRI